MAENYSLNSGFGFNISNKNATVAKKAPVENTALKAVGGLFDTVNNFFEKNEKVFSGDVAKEINMYSRQMMLVGMNLKASDDTIRKFDMNI